MIDFTNRKDTSDEAVNDFIKMFVVRRDAYELRIKNSNTGRTGYYTQCNMRWDPCCHIRKRDGVRCRDCEIQSFKPLTSAVIRAHMNGHDCMGNDVVAAYPVHSDDMCGLLVFDLDNHAKGAEQNDHANTDDVWKEEADALRKICAELKVDALMERSMTGKGAHLWIFFKELIPSWLAVRFGSALIEKGAETVDLKSFRYYDHMIPNRDRLPRAGLGRSVVLPLQGKALALGNSAFVDEDWNAYADQMKVLREVKRLSRKDVEDFISKWCDPDVDEDEDIDPWDYEPWAKDFAFSSEDVDGVLDITLSNGIYIKSAGLKNRFKRQLRRMAAFSNRQYQRNYAMDMPNFDEPRYIYLGKDEGDSIILPRGLKEEMFTRLDESGIRYRVDDNRTDGRKIKVRFKGELKDSQKQAADAMAGAENGILHAATAFGKTVVCCEMIARQGVSTLILVDRTDLMNQWIDRLNEFLEIDEELPTYTTKSGQVRKRKNLIGHLQGAHDSMTGIVDVAMIRSVKKKDGFHPMLKEYGQVILDECHHGASATAAEVLSEVNARHVYGATATPRRGDGKEKINLFLLGPIRFRFTARDRAREQGIDHLIYPRYTETDDPGTQARTPFGNDAFDLLRNNDERDEQIVNDVIECVEDGRTPVVMSGFVDHAGRLAEKLKGHADKVILLTGQSGTGTRKEQIKELNSVKDDETLILVGTGSLLGEGFDFPRLDTLFLATPVSGESVVEQYAGRLNRDYEGKKNVIVYDYVDSRVPKFFKMYQSRLRAYEQIGYEICDD